MIVKEKDGFTLVELLVAIGLIALVFGIGGYFIFNIIQRR